MGRQALNGPITDYVSGELRAQRSRKEWTIDQIAARSGLARSTIDRALKGRTALTIEVLVPLARALELDPGQLLRDAIKHLD